MSDVLDPFFSTYQMNYAVDAMPVDFYQVGTVSLPYWTGDPGILTLAGASSLTFQAEGGVPEPSTFVLVGAGLAGWILARRKADEIITGLQPTRMRPTTRQVS